MEEPDPKSMSPFVQLVLSIHSSGWVLLGKESTEKVEIDLPAVMRCIDFLIMLREKTKGNLVGEEEEILRTAISDLQLSYGEVVTSEEKTDEIK